jgi:hypothetical protein
MVALPAETPVTTPVTGFTVATALLLLLQLPPVAPLLVNVAVAPAHIVEEPLTVPAFGRALIVIFEDEEEPPQLLLTV